ncbi:MAG: F0F1 ATP synthase subunit delta [Candidatus Uhrbacteria bacterium]|nr:F0F1 ATP synthase subunit delta [Candidatus Uhrbacteria bacterium]
MKRNEKQLARTFVSSLEGATLAQVESTAGELVNLLASRGETHRVRRVIEAIEDAWRKQYGVATVTIETAHPLTSALRQKLEAIAPGVELREKVRPEIIGGARLRIDETIIDGSIEGHLLHLNQVLRNA